MRGMILAAGRGERMGVLTEQTPKPLLRVGNHYLIDYALINLKRAGIHDIVINVAYLGDHIKAALGDGRQYGVTITYSEEAERLETGGGIYQALPLLGNEPFIVTSCDIVTDFPFATLMSPLAGLGHLVMVDNPPYHPQGDFGLQNGTLTLDAAARLTFGNIAVFHPDFFATAEAGHFRLNKLLMPAILNKQLTGEHYTGCWYNVGTPADLHQLDQQSATWLSLSS